MKVSKGLFVLLICIGMLLGYSAHAQEESNTPEQETEEVEFDEAAFEEEDEQPTDAEQPEQEPEEEPEFAPEEEQPEEQEPEPELAPEEAPQEDAATEESSAEEQPEPETAQEQEQPQEQPEQEPAAEESADAEEKPESEEPEQEAEPEQPEVPMPPDEVMGLDTVDLEDPQGNWLFKRVWWERAEQKVEKVRELVTQIMEKRAGFFAKRAELDKNVLDPFYIDIGIKRGALTQKINDLISDVKSQEKVHRPDTVAFEKLQKDKKELDALALEVEKVTKQDEAVEKALLQLVDQINKLRNYEQQAWQDFKDIARVLDDKKARELFYKVDNAWQNVQKVQEYVEQTFTGSFDKLIQDVKTQIDRIKNDVDALKERGIMLYKQITKKEDVDEDGDAQQAEAKPEALRSFLDTFVAAVHRAFSALVAIVRWPYDKIVSTGQEAQQATQAREAMEVEVEVDAEESQSSPSETDEPELAPVQDQEAPDQGSQAQEPPELAPLSDEPEAPIASAPVEKAEETDVEAVAVEAPDQPDFSAPVEESPSYDQEPEFELAPADEGAPEQQEFEMQPEPEAAGLLEEEEDVLVDGFDPSEQEPPGGAVFDEDEQDSSIFDSEE